MRHLPSGEKDQEFDILNPKQLLPGLLQICSPAACSEIDAWGMEGHFSVSLASLGRKNTAPHQKKKNEPLPLPYRPVRA